MSVLAGPFYLSKPLAFEIEVLKSIYLSGFKVGVTLIHYTRTASSQLVFQLLLLKLVLNCSSFLALGSPVQRAKLKSLSYEN
ncbi:hypothetical protein Agabi119p4_2054 [Agaricus bisporus var. burnettii]|uniref:Uncharacterized protein n=1 Tax=Agaricus bisporus var. burnettii TaxID=192524 RepID=A0A8H7F8H8_AGABI|nr:hypothetical protein Agabi119p4_2054 [Agaricus bisporus var. burnettii]